MVTNMSKAKIYLLLLALGFIAGACGGGNGGGTASNTTPTPVPLNDAQQNLFSDVRQVIATKGQVDADGQQAGLPIIARNESDSPIQMIENTDGSPLDGNYYAVFSTEEYVMMGDENTFRNPTLVREPGQTELGKLGLSVGTDLGRDIDIVMLFNNDGNAVVALSSFNDFVAGGTAFVGLPVGDYSYSGVNYFKIGEGQIQSDDFGLNVNFGEGTGSFTSGFDGNITLGRDTAKGTYTGTEGEYGGWWSHVHSQ